MEALILLMNVALPLVVIVASMLFIINSQSVQMNKYVQKFSFEYMKAASSNIEKKYIIQEIKRERVSKKSRGLKKKLMARINPVKPSREDKVKIWILLYGFMQYVDNQSSSGNTIFRRDEDYSKMFQSGEPITFALASRYFDKYIIEIFFSLISKSSYEDIISLSRSEWCHMERVDKMEVARLFVRPQVSVFSDKHLREIFVDFIDYLTTEEIK